eukprot:CAMPEP_0170599274 /NCGR_PEP_ID=MMETSP0224-20130122/16705_1 /TAXON_ID=285029 /ORGANISM="Togula jolla, Strain CCCM 725" /LENGTH=103 /DNA_ID=CAMNT_0010923905 /DNA_START=162 /DNA_END=473 /DNA_ORIENTATION=-
MASTQLLAHVVHDVMQATLVIISVYAGWSAWAFVLQLLSPETPLHSPKTVCSTATSTTELDADSDSEQDTPLSFRLDSSASNAGFSILEHYGVLGASPGSWVL